MEVGDTRWVRGMGVSVFKLACVAVASMSSIVGTCRMEMGFSTCLEEG
jgi:hypothetical protein